MKKCFFLIIVQSIFFSFCGNEKVSKPVPPAKVENPVNESDLTKIILTEKAVERLGIQTTLVQQKNVSRTQILSGEIVGVPGSSVTITAPVAGTVLPARSGTFPQAGKSVRKGQELFRLLILPTEKDLLSARQDVEQKQVQYTVAREKLKRTEELYKEGAGSLKAKQEAEADLANVSAALKVAQARVELLSGRSGGLAERLSTLHVTASVSGVIQKVYTSSSQIVASGAPVADVVSLTPVWVRIPVYAGDIRRVNNDQPATIRSLSEFASSSNAIIARPVQGPQTADAQSSAVYLYYEFPNRDEKFLPGQKVSVTLPFKEYTASLVIPYSAVVYDIHGGTWVYENPSPLVFTRRRVEIENVQDTMAIIKRGLSNNTRLVISGAAELYGTEFGGGK